MHVVRSYHSSFRGLEELIFDCEDLAFRSRSIALEICSWKPLGKEAQDRNCLHRVSPRYCDVFSYVTHLFDQLELFVVGFAELDSIANAQYR